MTTQFRLPDLGEGITEAELVRWLVKPGDRVELDQQVAEVQTDKAIVELPSPVEGTVLELNVAEGQLVPVKTVLLTIGEGAAAALAPSTSPTLSPSSSETQRDQQGQAASLPIGSSPAGSSSTGVVEPVQANGVQSHGKTNGQRRVLATPVARRMARELGIDITTIAGSGPSGRVRTQDVQNYAHATQTETNGSFSLQKNGHGSAGTVATDARLAPSEAEATEQQPSPPAPAPTSSGLPGEAEQDEEHIPLRGLRRRIAENMVLSASTIPQVTSMVEVDASGLVALRQSLLTEAERQGVKLSYLPFIIKALVHTLRLYPYVNAAIEGEQIVLKHTYHIGIATATPDGLLVPVLRSADRLTSLELAREVNRLAESGRERKLQLHELRGSSFTISNYGTVGGFFTTPMINPGEAAILGLGRIVKRPWVVDDRIEVRPVLPLSFTADHRLIDGELAMRFLNTLTATLENPNVLLLNMR